MEMDMAPATLAPQQASGALLMDRLLAQGVVHSAICLLDPGGCITHWNATAERINGHPAEAVLGQHVGCLATAEDRAAGLPALSLALARDAGRHELEGWRQRRDGSRFWGEVVVQAVRDEDGTLTGFAQITRDRSAQKASADAMAELTANLELALAHMSHGLCLFDAAQRLVLCNDRFRETLGLTAARCRPGIALRRLLLRAWGAARPARRPGGRGGYADYRRAFAPPAEAGIAATELRHGARLLLVQTRALPDGGWVSTVEDITSRRRIEAQMLHLAEHDVLTGLPNRASFIRRLEEVLQPGGPDCAVLFLDLDRFKPVNDTLGHLAGDRVLQEVAVRLQALLRPGDMAARLGGDEFAMLRVGPDSSTEAALLAERLLQTIGQPIRLQVQQVGIGTSIGIACAPADGQEAELLLRHADLALYRAKQERRNRYRYYQPAMDQRMVERRQLERDLRQALEQGEFSLHYQPVIGVRSGRIGGFEALLRWHSPVRGMVGPGDFIPLAEEIGLMPEIGAWVLRAACQEAVGWPPEVKVSVNVSATQFADDRLVQTVAEALAVSGLPPGRLELEITETAMIVNTEATIETLQAIAAMGIGIAMDDFGTGYSSLSFLHRFPFTRIKIDQSFVRGLGQDPQSDAIVRAVTGLCDSLGVASTAEGVETEAQWDFLRQQNCAAIQGYLISRPQPAHAVGRMLLESQRAGC